MFKCTAEVTTLLMNRVQLQPGLRSARFLARYGSEAACAQALARLVGRVRAPALSRHGQGYRQCRACVA